MQLMPMHGAVSHRGLPATSSPAWRRPSQHVCSSSRRPSVNSVTQSNRRRKSRGNVSLLKEEEQQHHTLTADAQLTTRKNSELYSLIGDESKQPAQQRFQDLAGLRVSSTAGIIGSTGTFGALLSPKQQQEGFHNGHNSSNTSQQGGSSNCSQAPGASAPSAPARSVIVRPLVDRPEVLSPAGGWPQLRAAVENGADAVYFGVTGFNARARATNFGPDEVPHVMAYLHERGVKGYMALNILVFNEELSCLEQLVRQIAEAGVDAVIVQDIGAVSLIRAVAPALPIHGSTQMSITSAEGADFAAGLGVTRVVVGRELSVREIAKLSSNTSVEVEAFCHGALCVSYSGQCFSSEAWGGRSANRGQCAQACRMPYALLVDGQIKDLADINYLLSPQDLMALDHIPDMIAAGVGCFKIEGRLKGPEYVAATTAAYRAGVDAAWEQLSKQQQRDAQQQQRQQDQQRRLSNQLASTSTSSSSRTAISFERLNSLYQVFSRGQDEIYTGLTPGFLDGSKHQRLVRGRAPRHRGLCLGRVAGYTKRGVVIQGLLNPVKRGDGLVFDQGSPEVREEGGSVWEIYDAGHSTKAPVSEQQPQKSSPAYKGKIASGPCQQYSSKRGGTGDILLLPTSRRPVDGEAPAGSAVELVFGRDQVDMHRVPVGALVWKTRDNALEAKLRATYEAVSSTSARKLPVQVFVSGSLGTPLQLKLVDADSNTATADTGDILLQPASKHAMTGADVEARVGQLGDNMLAPVSLDTSALALEQGLFLPASAFKAMRRGAAEQLVALRQQHQYAEGLAQQPVLPEKLASAAANSTAITKLGSSNSGSSSSSSQVTSMPSSNGIAQPPRWRQQQQPTLRVLCRTPGQVQAAVQVPWLQEVIVDFLEVHGLKEAVQAIQAAGKQAVVALPRILKPDETRLLWFYLRLNSDALLLRGAGCLQQLLGLGGTGAVVQGIGPLNRSSGTGSTSSSHASAAGIGATAAAGAGGSTAAAAAAATAGSAAGTTSGSSSPMVIPRLEGDFSLNAANTLAADLLLQSGLSRLCPTHDLNAGQLAALAQGLGGMKAAGRAQQLEAVIHQHLPIFHTEHCVFCRFLSAGDNYLNCGHPCEKHTVQLRDSNGADHLVLADMGCRNTVFNASAQSGLYCVPQLVAAGYRTFRVELVDEHPEVVMELLEGYQSVLDGKQRPKEVWGWLQESCKGGVSAGSLEVTIERAAASLRPTARRG